MIHVLPYANEHLPGVLDVILPIQVAEFGIPITLEAQPDLLDIPGFYRRGEGNFWVALSGQEVVGTLGLLDIGNRQGALRKMFVKAPYRGAGHGVARLLLEGLRQWSAGRGMEAIFLGTTTKFLAAHRFYEKNGFQRIPVSNLPPAFPVLAVDSIFYRLDLEVS